MKTRVAGAVLAAMVIGSFLGGCQAFYFMKGEKIKAQFTLPKDKRVLVFVDTRQGVNPPPDFSSVLGTKISDELYKYKSANRLVGQERLAAVTRDPIEFGKMGVADVARAVDADLVVYVDVVTLHVTSTTDESISQGNAQVLVKVIDANGVRMWPTMESTGSLVSASVDPALLESRSEASMVTEIQGTLATRIGKLFRESSPDEDLAMKGKPKGN